MVCCGIFSPHLHGKEVGFSSLTLEAGEVEFHGDCSAFWVFIHSDLEDMMDRCLNHACKKCSRLILDKYDVPNILKL